MNLLVEVMLSRRMMMWQIAMILILVDVHNVKIVVKKRVAEEKEKREKVTLR